MSRLFFTAIIVDDCVAKSKFNNVYSCRHSLFDIMRATDVVFGGKRAFCMRLRQCGQGLFFLLRGSDARVFIAECDPSAVFDWRAWRVSKRQAIERSSFPSQTLRRHHFGPHEGQSLMWIVPFFPDGHSVLMLASRPTLNFELCRWPPVLGVHHQASRGSFRLP